MPPLSASRAKAPAPVKLADPTIPSATSMTYGQTTNSPVAYGNTTNMAPKGHSIATASPGYTMSQLDVSQPPALDYIDVARQAAARKSSQISKQSAATHSSESDDQDDDENYDDDADTGTRKRAGAKKRKADRFANILYCYDTGF